MDSIPSCSMATRCNEQRYNTAMLAALRRKINNKMTTHHDTSHFSTLGEQPNAPVKPSGCLLYHRFARQQVAWEVLLMVLATLSQWMAWGTSAAPESSSEPLRACSSRSNFSSWESKSVKLPVADNE
mmetsp:Transcript_45646/g.67341  ORF Transcript_45646/g.67341 Transcript_45646/m.67341 type:complete len:127 (+) Transcript_45646:1-381(+)